MRNRAQQLLSASAPRKFYISNSGNDSLSGRSPSQAWGTIDKINSSTFKPGDRILFKKGDIWREQLTIPSSGSTGKPITFSSYGTGARPIISGADIITNFASEGSNVWSVNCPNATTTRAMVIIGGIVFSEVDSQAAVNSASKYFIDVSANPDKLYIYSDTDPNTLSAEVSKRDYCILGRDIDLRHHINITGLDFRGAGHSGVAFFGTQGGPQHLGHCNIDDCNFYANRLFGAVAYDGHSYCTFKNSTATFCGNGFYSWISDNVSHINCTTSDSIAHVIAPNNSDGHAHGNYQGKNWLVEGCTSIRDNDSIHIDAGGVATPAIIRYNKIFNSKTGVPPTPGMGTGSLGAGATIQIYYNLIVNCASAAFESFSAHVGTVEFYNNTIFLAPTWGEEGGTFFLQVGTNFVLKNNIFARTAIDGKSLLTVATGSVPTSDYNQWYQAAGANYRWHYNGSNYTTIATWRTASSQDINSKVGDPLFINNASDWSLQSSSPAINAGTNLGFTRDILGNPVSDTPDMGCYEFQ